VIRDLLPAIFGLVGVVIGGVLNGAVSWRAERRRARLRSVVGARVIRSELKESCNIAMCCLTEESLDLIGNEKLFGVPSWTEYREVLSQNGLESDDRFKTVEGAVRHVKSYEALKELTKWEESGERTLWSLVRDLEEAQSVLTPLCRGDHVHPWRARWRKWRRGSEKEAGEQAVSPLA
jgi:hypothetical protein